MTAFSQTSFSTTAFSTLAFDLAPVAAGLAVKRGSTRSIDAKTLADRFNAGQPLQADYEFPNGRKFYQPGNTP